MEDEHAGTSSSGLPPSLLELDVYLLSRVGKAARSAVAERLAEHGLRLWHMAVLAALADFGAQPQRDLSRRLSIHPSDTAKIVDELNRAGWTLSTRDPADRRRVLVELTEAGQATLAVLHEDVRVARELILAPLDDGERRLLYALLRRVFDGLVDSSTQAAPERG